MRKWITLLSVTALAVGMLYLSRFWFLSLWPRNAVPGLPPQGGVLGRWLRGTDLAPFELLIWAVGVFVVLTCAQKIFDRLTAKGDPHEQ